jgi:Zn-dependent peptidase ImmA (M78 family)
MNIKDIKRKHIECMVMYCYEVLGPSKYYTTLPHVKINHGKKKNHFMGEYDWEDNTIIINMSSHSSLIELCSTVIHEYVHHTQSSAMYYKIDNKIDYDDNPYEKKANLVAEELKWDCRRYIIKTSVRG